MQMGTTFTPPSYLKMQLLPSITGRPAAAPISPKPRTAVPLVIIAAQLALKVNSRTREGVSKISSSIPSYEALSMSS